MAQYIQEQQQQNIQLSAVNPEPVQLPQIPTVIDQQWSQSIHQQNTLYGNVNPYLVPDGNNIEIPEEGEIIDNNNYP